MTVNTGILLDTVALGVQAKLTMDIADYVMKGPRKSKKRKVKQNTYGDWW